MQPAITSPGDRGRGPDAYRRALRLAFHACCLTSLALPLGGCTSAREYIQNGFKVGPNYGKPPAPVAGDWIDAADKRLSHDPDDMCEWWRVFHDPVLDQLICFAYRQNLTLREAGFRVLQARARLGIAVGELLPQSQFARADFTWNALSAENASSSQLRGNRFFSQWSYGFNLAWELDFWGRFRRAVENADANLDASVEDYDFALVTLLGDVATNYVQLRTTEKRIEYAKQNVALQQKTVGFLKARKQLQPAYIPSDLPQALSVLAQTEATIPELEITLRQSVTQLCVLLGIPPEELAAKLGPGPIPLAPPEVAVGIPADLLRRRPDVRRAERLAAAQSALIGVAESEFYPHISLVGTLGWSAESFKNLFRSSAFTGSFGPQVQWNILNYGRLLNNVRFQDARFQELVAGYQQSVLTAGQEAENGLVTFLKAEQRAKLLGESVAQGVEALRLANLRLPLAQSDSDFLRVNQIQQNLVTQQDTLAVAQGEIATGLIQVYRALGGGWQIRCDGCPTPSLFSPATTLPLADAPAVKIRAHLGQPQ